MSVVTGLMVYVVIWWVVFFMTLPVGVRTADEAGEAKTPGTADSAPVRPRLWLKAGATTVLAGLAWGLFYLALQQGFFGLGDYVRR
jgi:predicted secreted protein